MTAFRLEYSGKEPEYGDDGVPGVMGGHDVVLRLWGAGLTDNTLITLTKDTGSYGGPCLQPATQFFPISIYKKVVDSSLTKKTPSPSNGTTTNIYPEIVTATVRFTAPQDAGSYYFCLKYKDIESKVSFFYIFL